MVEFERFDEGMPPERMLPDGRLLAADFSADDAEVAYWFNEQFNIAGENLPPRYAQTLLGDPRHAPAGEDFEAQITDDVFRRLHLTRPTPAPKADRTFATRLRAGTERLKQRVMRQGTLAIMALMMLVSYNALGTGVAMASMLQIFAGHGGTQSVSKYPTVFAPTTDAADTNSLNYSLQFQPQWPGQSINGFTFLNLDVYPSQAWSDGSMMLLHYVRQDGLSMHRLDIFEFMPQAPHAMQVVQAGAATNVPIGNSTGIFVTGQWSTHAHGQVWHTGTRSELILPDSKKTDPIIWIATNTNDDAATTLQTLTHIAGSMGAFQYSSVASTASGMRLLSGTMAATVNNLFGNDVIALIGNDTTPNASVLYIPIDPTLAPMTSRQQGDST